MEELQQLIGAVVAGDQQAMQQFQQIIQDPQQGPQIMQAIQTLAQQGDTNAQQIVQMMQGGGQQTVAARLGTKLVKIMELNGKCPEGYQYMKIGGSFGKCLKCGGTADKAKSEKLSPADEFKKSKKAEKGDKLNKQTGKDPKAKAPIGKKRIGGTITAETIDTLRKFTKK